MKIANNIIKDHLKNVYMCLTGMELDGLYACFPAFPKDEIEKIYNEVKNQPEDGAEDNVISVNCS